MNIEKDVRAFTGTCTTNQRCDLTAEEIIANMKEALASIPPLPEKPVIKVWVGDNPFMMGMDKAPVPSIQQSDMLQQDEIFIVAGCGVICGYESFRLLMKHGIKAVWTDEVPK